MSLTIVAISDTHGLHHAVTIPPGDVLVHAGDLTRHGTLDELDDLNEWLGALSHRVKIVIAGNHDWCLEEDEAATRARLPNAVYLRDEALVVDGVTFYGSPWQPRFYDWAFNLPRGPQIRQKWNVIPPQTNVRAQARKHMTLTLQEPPPALADAVELLWWYKGAVPPHAFERMLPSTAMQLVINLHGDSTAVARGPEPDHFEQLGGAVLCGVYTEPFVIPTAQQTACVGVVFRPGGATPFLGGFPASDLRNAHVSLDDLWGAAADRLVAQLHETTMPEGGLAVLAHALHEQRRAMVQSHPSLEVALARLRGGAYRNAIAHLASELGLSQQRLGRLFRDHVGLSPKQVSRVWRFEAVLRSLRNEPSSGWAERAVENGYADQAHLVRDFHALTGLAPAAYQSCWGTLQNHLPLPG